MKWINYFDSLTDEQKESYASRCETSVLYINTHLRHSRRIPRKEFLQALANYSEGNVVFQDVLDHFYSDALKQSA